ncbi:MAG: hypothetical protein EOP48_10335, partial [Sphingobacteriales bacterium]
MPELSDWQNSHYILLSEEIAKHTKTNISKNTLKRFFGKMKTDQFYYPQKATLDAIAVYLGYKNWADFAECQPVKQPEYIWNGRLASKSSNRQFYKVISIVIVVGCFLSLVIYGFYNSKNNETDRRLSITCENPVGLYSHSAIFQLNGLHPSTDSSTYLVDFSDRVKVPVENGQKNLVHHFQTPGWYPVALLKNGTRVDTALVKVRSNGWAAYTMGSIYAPGRFPLKIPITGFLGRKKFNNRDIRKAGQDTLSAFFVNFVNIKETSISGDNFMLQTFVRTAERQLDEKCNGVYINVYGQYDDHYLSINNKECVAWSNANFSETVRDGQINNLSFMGVDLSGGGRIKLI